MKKIPLFVFAVFLFSCSKQPNYPVGHFPEGVVSYPEVNSKYDDYNSNLDRLHNQFSLQFSSNRYSAGKQFDIVHFEGVYSWDQEKAVFHIGIVPPSWSGQDYSAFYDTINSPANELGPYSQDLFIEDAYKYLFLFATDGSGNFDIKFLYPQKANGQQASGAFAAVNSPQGINYINTSANELYPSFYSETNSFSNSTLRKLFYCSDKAGNFDIYQVDFGEGGDVLTMLTSKASYLSQALPINSAAEDKCPFFHDNVLIFASNRAGGYGGFDLYYSLYENGSFSEPVNLGEDFNTEADEYRPILISDRGFNNDLILFSSNRPGGKGGFDLYYSGVTIERQK